MSGRSSWVCSRIGRDGFCPECNGTVELVFKDAACFRCGGPIDVATGMCGTSKKRNAAICADCAVRELEEKGAFED